MGARGPVPNASEDLARPRERKGGDQQPITKGDRRPVVIPEPGEDWHPIATMLWDAMALSGQADLYQQSDWAYAYNLCEELSVYKKPSVDRNGVEYHKRSGQMFQAINTAMERLLLTEGDRRRVRVELTEPETGDEDAATVAVMDDYRAGLSVVPDLPADA